MKFTSISSLALVGGLSYAEAMKVNLPPYWDPEYANTWRYTEERRYVNEEQWKSDAPVGYNDLVDRPDNSFTQTEMS